ncbi:hypothetical protein DFH09DRAFT_347488 [Mycena vulgaris]|nr:hypothetical protein DFH09DRAFT_347488 [Mycena vulgaris]
MDVTPQMFPDSEFGSFMSVPAAQDPLSLMTPGLGLASPMQPASSPSRPSNPRTASQIFFDQFSHSAKNWIERKRDLLDETIHAQGRHHKLSLARSNSYGSLGSLSKSSGAKRVASFLSTALSPPGPAAEISCLSWHYFIM